MNPSAPRSPFFLPPLKSENRGGDFLGLRQANLDMMADVIPGTNNVTPYLRPFALLSWIFYKFHELCERENKLSPTNLEARAFRERIEILYTWGAKLTDAADLPGKTSEAPVGSDGKAELTFHAWGRVQSSTSLIAAIQYGPASKTLAGLGFLDPIGPELYRTTGRGIALARALDAKLRENVALYSRLLDTLRPVNASASDAASLWEIWGVGSATEPEQVAFREALFDERAIGIYAHPTGRRSSTIALARLHLKKADRPLPSNDVRRGMYYAGDDFLTYKLPEQLRLARTKWIVLQVRQLQRFALENLLSWCEHKILDGARDISSLVTDAEIAFREHDFDLPSKNSASDIMATLTESAESLEEIAARGQANALFCPFALMGRIHGMRSQITDEISANCIYCIFLCAAIAKCSTINDKRLLSIGGQYRQSLSYICQRFDALGSSPLAVAFGFILETLVISQHFAIAVNRFDGQNQRLRLTIEENGLETLVSKPWAPKVTEDRLPTLLRLCSDCGLIRRPSDDTFTA